MGSEVIESKDGDAQLHQALVAALRRHLSATYHDGVRADGDGSRSEPPVIGRHRPDVYLVTQSGLPVVGAAKTGPDLTAQATREELDDFTLHQGRNGQRAIFWLAVPVGWRRKAIEAIAEAAGEIHGRVHVLEVPEAAGR